jgi:hypothetical protein
MTPVGPLSLLLAAAVLVADGRTVLKPGWNMFSPQQDVEVGQQVSPDAERQLRMLNNSRVDNYVNDLGRRLAARATGEKYPYRFRVVNDRAINAFALPGGPIYINRGVIETVANESQLSGVIAHEAAHVALRHGTNQASKASPQDSFDSGGLIGNNSTRAALAQLGASCRELHPPEALRRPCQPTSWGPRPTIRHDPRAMGQFLRSRPTDGPRAVEFFSNHPNPKPHRTREPGSERARRRAGQ